MATIVPRYLSDKDYVLVSWPGMATGDVALPHRVLGKPDMVVAQVEGTFNNTKIAIQGSLSNVAYVSATDMTQSTIQFSSNAAAGVLEPFTYWKPTVSFGATDNVSIYLSYWVA